MAYEPKQWNRDFARWTADHPAETKYLRDTLGTKPVKDYQVGRIADLDSLNPHTRALLYKTTGIDAFKFDTYVDPDTLQLRAILDGSAPRTALPIWLGGKKLNKTALAQAARVDRKLVDSFIDDKPMRGEGASKILSALRKYASHYESSSVDAGDTGRGAKDSSVAGEVAGQVVRSSGKSELDVLAGAVARLYEGVQALGGKVQLGEDAWKARGEYAIDLLARVMDHYASAPPAERKAFVEQLKREDQVALFGWVGNIFSGLLKEDGSPDVFARSMRPARLGRRE